MKIIFIILFVLFPGITFALSTDKLQNAIIESDSATINHKTNTCIYRGHVKLTQGTTILTADLLTTYSNAKNQLQKAIAIGQLATYTTLPDNSSTSFIAQAKTINYNPLQSQIILVGDAKATQGSDSFAGPQINYNIKQQLVTTPASKQGRTTIVFQPGQRVSLPHE